jgi:hypothetical protein
MRERRIESRLLCAELVELTWTDSSGNECRRLVNLEDISSSGLGVQMEIPIRPGTPITVHYPNGEFHGRVRYCAFRDVGYFLGVEFDEDSTWSAVHFQPEHLLDPADLIREAASEQTSVADLANLNSILFRNVGPTEK